MVKKLPKTKIFNLPANFKSIDEDDDSITIRGLASTNATDRVGDVIDHAAWTKGGLDNFKNNPIILFNHDYNRPIGKATDIRVTSAGLEITAVISKAAGDVYNLIKEGVLSAFSVGFAIKDADYIKSSDSFLIKDAELYETSVVSIPCNQTALFSVSKSLTDEELDNFKSVCLAGHSLANKEVNTSGRASDTLSGRDLPREKKSMDEEEIKLLVAKAAKEAAEKAAKATSDAHEAARVAAEAAAAEKAAKEESEKKASEAITSGMTTAAEKIFSAVEEKLSARDADMGAVIDGFKTELKAANDELMKLRDSKRVFSDRTGGTDWKTDKRMAQEVDDAVILQLAMGKKAPKLTDTKFGKEVVEKVNAHSGVEVSSADFEQEVSTNVERDIQLQLVLAPLFREITMRSASQIIPILPDAGYAEFTTSQTAAGSSPHGNIATRGDTFGAPYGGNDLTEVSLSTFKLMSQSYLGNETEEDAILPILPLIRETIIRSHARGIENALLAGNHADGVYTSGIFNGLIKLASTSSRYTQSATAYASYVLTGDQLLAARKNMGKYGINQNDVVYIVSPTGYYQLLEDTDFQDWTQVQDMSTKMTGEVGKIFGSKVLVCDEFATPAVSKFHALAVNTRNFLMPRLRGFRMESDYETANQRTVIVGSQRMGFNELIASATAVHGLQYKAS